MQNEIQNIIFIGSGNLATQMAKAFFKKGLHIQQIYSRKESNAIELANMVNAEAICELQKLSNNADLYIVTLADKAIGKIVKEISLQNKILVHTSGSEPMDVLSDTSENFGVFYPLNTFSKNKLIKLETTPFFIEANNKKTSNLLIHLAKQISGQVDEADSRQRLIIHMAAVFASNFVNHMYAISADILEKNALSFDIMKPIILEVAQKAIEYKPANSQTGPALREDYTTLEKHLGLLNEFPAYKNLYEQITKDIITRYKKPEKHDKL